MVSRTACAGQQISGLNCSSDMSDFTYVCVVFFVVVVLFFKQSF